MDNQGGKSSQKASGMGDRKSSSKGGKPRDAGNSTSLWLASTAYAVGASSIATSGRTARG